HFVQLRIAAGSHQRTSLSDPVTRCLQLNELRKQLKQQLQRCYPLIMCDADVYVRLDWTLSQLKVSL
ncbi:hypothetical protein AVEN_11538-1, partial [Araneus ventricosus]